LHGTVETLVYAEVRGKPETKLAPKLPQRKQVKKQDYLIWKSYVIVPSIFSYFLYKLYNVFPSIIQYVPGSHQTVLRNWEKLKLFIYQMMESHRKDWNPDEPRDFIDAFLTEMSKVRRTSGLGLPGNKNMVEKLPTDLAS
jgi:hypothetical protein